MLSNDKYSVEVELRNFSAELVKAMNLDLQSNLDIDNFFVARSLLIPSIRRLSTEMNLDTNRLRKLPKPVPLKPIALHNWMHTHFSWQCNAEVGSPLDKHWDSLRITQRTSVGTTPPLESGFRLQDELYIAVEERIHELLKGDDGLPVTNS